jgi:hypothetical protein
MYPLPYADLKCRNMFTITSSMLSATKQVVFVLLRILMRANVGIQNAMRRAYYVRHSSVRCRELEHPR